MESIFEKYGLPKQPGEVSWAAFKCGGGPHAQDIDTVHPAVRAASQSTLTNEQVNLEALRREVLDIHEKAADRDQGKASRNRIIDITDKLC